MPKPKEYVAFDALMGKLLTVPKAVVDGRMREHRENAAKNPRKRGPKPKRVTASASDDDPAAE